ncbi:RDD family protein [Streptomyces sp. NPDC050732]|uniref:RDD family protein n=1 Tax=Streptomyces sp. NPDC050732 TaxID=3154632 RepID=UPI0034389D9C
MSAPTPAPGDERPREGYYPDPSIPGYVRYWNGTAWVPGTSRPAPSDGEPLPPPPGVTPAPAPAEETGPVFFDEHHPRTGQFETGPPDTGPIATGALGEGVSGAVSSATGQAQAGQAHAGQGAAGQAVPGQFPPGHSVPGQGAAGQAVPGQAASGHAVSGQKASGQPGQGAAGQPASGQAVPGQHGGRPEPASAWQADAGRQAGLGGEQERRVAWGGEPERSDPRVPNDAAPRAEAAAESAGPSHDDSNPGTVTIRAVKPGAAEPTAGEGTVTFRRPTPSAGTDGTMSIRAIRPKSAQPVANPSVANPSVPNPSAPQSSVPPQGSVPPQAQPSVPQQGGVPAPVTSGPGGGAQSWAQQVHQLAQAPVEPAPAQQGEGQPVVPWKPVAADPFLAVAQAQAAARPAGLGRRLAARLLDTVVLAVVTGAAALPLGTKAADHIDSKIDAAKLSGEKTTVWLLDGTTAGYLGMILAVLLLFGVVYEALPTAKWGRTLGKKVCGVEVRDIEEHEAPTFGAALKRWLVYSVPGVLVIGVVGVLWCLFDRPWRQCWHDKAANTFVAG